MKIVTSLAAGAVSLISLQAQASCPPGQVEESVLIGNICIPGPIVDIFNPQRITSGALQIWIEQSHNTAQNGASPIPPPIRKALTGFIPEDVLGRARFRVGDQGIVNLAGSILRNNTDIAAVTLMDVIVFNNDDDAQTNSILWAHELWHVKEYGDWGVDEFARTYVNDYHNAENPAYEKQYAFPRWSTLHPQPPQPFHADYGNLHARILCVSGSVQIQGIANDWNHKFLDVSFTTPSSSRCGGSSGHEVNVVAPEGSGRTDILKSGNNQIAFVVSPTTPEYSVRIQLYTWQNGHKHLVYDVQKDNNLGGQPAPIDFTYQ